jgi:hypothetical protein
MAQEAYLPGLLTTGTQKKLHRLDHLRWGHGRRQVSDLPSGRG